MPAIDRALRDVQYGDCANLAARQSLHQRFGTNPHPWPRWVFDRLVELPLARDVLEIGCGGGTLWALNLERVPSGWRIALADFSAGMLRDARRLLGDFAARCAFLQLDAQAIPLARGSCDAVIANHMLYHVPDRRAALAEIRRVLRPGGWLVAATNGPAHLAEIDALIARFAPEQPRANETVARRFGLETGGPMLREQFVDVSLRRYEDELRVTEADALLAYVESMARAEALPPSDLAHLRRAIEAEIRSRGAFHVTKETGLFVAR